MMRIFGVCYSLETNVNYVIGLLIRYKYKINKLNYTYIV